ncbi:MAG: hypothetical protein J2P23_09040 [Microlunatus sp.]|nr:hypothetical protein [Microlunatus sp.]
MTLIVRLRPNAAYLALLAIGIAVIMIGAFVGGAVGVVLIVCGAVLAVALGFPVVASTVFRVPVIAVGPDGIRMPLVSPSIPLQLSPGPRRP